MTSYRGAVLVLAAAWRSWAEDLEVCSGEDCPAVLLLQDRLAFHSDVASPFRAAAVGDWEPHETVGTRPLASLPHGHSWQAGAEHRSSSLLQAEVEELETELAAEEQLLHHKQLASAQNVVSQSARRFTGVLIGLVMAASVLIFGICMSMSLGLWRASDTGVRRRVSCGDWAVGLGVSAVLLVLQLCAFHQIGFLNIPAEGDFSPEIVAVSILVSCAGPVACLAFFKCHTSLEHLDDEFSVVERRFDRLEKIVSAGFTTSLREEQVLLDSIKRQLDRRG
mmetsp:Transcript_26598/g.63411  ORF Transcript_26598/g.63411 Transcript_26598/m.63411 type:complete len:279 (+) Transcript_26598:51-887(+)|eukprot:CAMPEP_0181432390 /NCGR_PEP_ID=MMETSP1110-20121109/18745_1 /TAXON_ID=174948 /ORGANISM="Symbiodinium sp., Strain CCMP421" /LENGTH=278 /DNA_ID=CAMNT_0023555797 /DNA_START=44 /DNA_END=880 /DNA_ORIENTATION=+